MRKTLDVIDKISYIGFIPAIALIFILMLMNIINVAARLSGAPMSGITNLGEFMLVGAIFLSLAYCQVRKQHLFIELFLTRMEGKTRQGFDIVNGFLSLAVCAVLVWLSWVLASESFIAGERITGAPFYPIYPGKIALFVGVCLLTLQLLADFIRIILGLGTGPQKAKDIL
jgi:TRAP-type C4-dicarboxylate transport system permease small subunit